MTEKGFSPIVIILGVLLISSGIIAGAYYLKTQQNSSQTSNLVVQPTTSPNTTQTQQSSNSKFLKKQFSITQDQFASAGYPVEVVNLVNNEESLIGMGCSPRYECGEGICTYYEQDSDQTKPPQQLTDNKTLNLYKEAVNTLAGSNYTSVQSFRTCDTEDNRTIIEYEVWGGGGGGANVAYFGQVKADGSIDKIDTILNDGVAYFGCGKLLMLTKDNLLYVQCGGEGGSSIYKVDLNKRMHALLKKCTFAYDELSNKETINCQ